MEEKLNPAFVKAEKACGDWKDTQNNSNNQQNHSVSQQKQHDSSLATKLERDRAKLFKREERAKRIADKRTNRQRKKQEKRRKNGEKQIKNKGWLAAVIALSITSFALLTALTVILVTPNSEGLALESVYRKSFYDTVDQVDNMDSNMSKILATKDEQSIQVYLTDLAINSELCENEIQQLPLQDETKFYTAKLINQIGDFAKYLNKNLIDGKGLTDSDRQTLKTLYGYNLQLKNSLEDMQAQMGGDFSFKEVSSGKRGSAVIKGFSDLQNLSVQYPELIYDGPFSDGLDSREVKGLTGNEITHSEAKDIFTKIFAGYGLEKVTEQGEVNSIIPCYAVSGEKKGEVLYAQFTKTGGKLLMFAYSGDCKSVEFSEDYATEKALEFLSEIGYQGLKPVWINLANNVYTINFAFEENGVIVYSDLIKVRVCAQTCTVLGLEASSYIINHTERTIDNAKITIQTAKEKLANDMQVITCRKCLVPIGNSAEKLCYEFCCENDGATFYAYIDATNGRQVQLFRVIETTEGKLLI